MTGRMPKASIKKITAGQGPTVLAGVKIDAGQIPSRVLMATARRGIGTFLQESISSIVLV
jgi:RNA:NAD 2'-phosphotransferase (TPT1/KptA family)